MSNSSDIFHYCSVYFKNAQTFGICSTQRQQVSQVSLDEKYWLFFVLGALPDYFIGSRWVLHFKKIWSIVCLLLPPFQSWLWSLLNFSLICFPDWKAWVTLSCEGGQGTGRGCHLLPSSRSPSPVTSSTGFSSEPTQGGWKVNVNQAGGSGHEDLERMQMSEYCLFQMQKPIKLLNEGKELF